MLASVEFVIFAQKNIRAFLLIILILVITALVLYFVIPVFFSFLSKRDLEQYIKIQKGYSALQEGKVVYIRYDGKTVAHVILDSDEPITQTDADRLFQAVKKEREGEDAEAKD